MIQGKKKVLVLRTEKPCSLTRTDGYRGHAPFTRTDATEATPTSLDFIAQKHSLVTAISTPHLGHASFTGIDSLSLGLMAQKPRLLYCH